MSCPSLGSSSVEAALKKLVEDGTLRRLGAGRKTLYVRADFERRRGGIGASFLGFGTAKKNNVYWRHL